MRKIYILPLVFLASAIGVASAQQPGDAKKQDAKTEKPAAAAAAVTIKADATPLELAKTTLAAHGGEKFKNAKTIVVRGSAELTAPNSAQTLPAAFAIIYAGDRYRFDIQAPPVINFQQISNGDQHYSSMRGLSLPPLNRVGPAVLVYLETKDFVVSALPEKFKKKKGFRVTSPEGYYTDFIIDEKTALVKEYESSYEVGGQLVTTAVAVDKYRDVQGVLINEKFSQRLEFGQITSYASFKAKEITVNTEVKDDVFKIPN
jgi:hypothetical protein